jgi:hypothetical protein
MTVPRVLLVWSVTIVCWSASLQARGHGAVPAAGRSSSSASPSAFAKASPDKQPPPRLVIVDDESELEAALAARTPPRDVAVRVTGVSLPDADPAKARLLIFADIANAPRTGALASVAYVLEDERGQVRARGLRRGELRTTPAGSLAFLEVVLLPPGAYRLKLAAMRNNKVGAAQADLTVRVQSAATFRFGDLVVGESVSDDIGSNLSFDRLIRGDRLVASLPFAATGTSSVADLAISVEVAKNAAGAAMISGPAAALSGQETVRVAQAVLDVRALPAGDYVARAVVSVAGKETCRSMAPFTRGQPAAGSAPAPASGTPAGPRSRGVPAPPVPGAGFHAEDVLEAAVLRPFLDELAARASDRAKPAIDRAKAGRFIDAAQAAASGAGDPNDPVTPFLQGLSLLSQKQLQAASDAFRETLRAAPDFFVGAFYIGACYAAGGRDPQAVNAWQTSLVGLDQYPIVFRLLGDALTRMGQADRALEILDEAREKWPADQAIRLHTARAALEAKRYDRVFALVDESMPRQPAADLLFTGMQAAFEQASERTEAPGDEMMVRLRRYRDAYAAAGGTQQALVAEWIAALERKK